MEYIAIILLVIVVILSVFINIRLLTKVEQYEDIVEYQSNYIRNLSTIINESNSKLNETDLRGSFEADDEIGWFFNSLKEIQETLNDYNLLDAYGEKKE